MTALHALTAGELLAGYRAGRFSPLEVAQAVVAQVERWEPHIHATWGFDAQAVLAQARDSVARWQRGEAAGALDGVPVTLKENIATRGVPVPLGSAATELVPATEDAPPAARLREAGAVLLGKTATPWTAPVVDGSGASTPMTSNQTSLILRSWPSAGSAPNSSRRTAAPMTATWAVSYTHLTLPTSDLV